MPYVYLENQRIVVTTRFQTFVLRTPKNGIASYGCQSLLLQQGQVHPFGLPVSPLRAASMHPSRNPTGINARRFHLGRKHAPIRMARPAGSESL